MSIYYSRWNVRRMRTKRLHDGDDKDDDSNFTAGFSRKRIHLTGSLYEQARKGLESMKKQSAHSSLDDIYKQALAATKEKQYAYAYDRYKAMLAAAQRAGRADTDTYITRARNALKGIEKRAAQVLTRIEKGLSSKNPDKAVKDFGLFEKAYGAFKESPEIHKRYMRLTRDPKLAKIKGSGEAAEHIAQAEEYYKGKQYGYAWHELQMVAEQYPDTEQAAQAKKRIREIEAELDIIVKVHETPRERYARELVRRADEKVEKRDIMGARRLYEYVIKRYPDCEAVGRMAKNKLRQTQ